MSKARQEFTGIRFWVPSRSVNSSFLCVHFYDQKRWDIILLEALCIPRVLDPPVKLEEGSLCE